MEDVDVENAGGDDETQMLNPAGSRRSLGSTGKLSRGGSRHSISSIRSKGSRGSKKSFRKSPSLTRQGSATSAFVAEDNSHSKVANSLLSKKQRKKVIAARKQAEQEEKLAALMERKRKMVQPPDPRFVWFKYQVRAASGWATLAYAFAFVPWLGVIVGLYKLHGNPRVVRNGEREACEVITPKGVCLGPRECDNALYGYDLFWVIVYPLAMILFTWLYFKRSDTMRRLKRPGGW